MNVRMLILLVLVLAALMTACLDDLFPLVDYEIQQFMRLNPLGAPNSNTRFYDGSRGKAYSFDSANVYYIGTRLWRKPINDYSATSLLPGNLICTDRTWLAADSTRQMLFVAVGNHIYSLKFDGAELTNLTPADTDTLRAPALSPDKRYLTFIRSGKINRLDLQTGTRIEIDNSPDAEYAIYRPDQDRYFFFSTFTYPYGRQLFFCEADGSSPQRLMWDDGDNTVFSISADGRWFGLLNKPYKTVSDDNTLRIWGSDAKDGFVLLRCSAFAFSPSSTELYYSQKAFGTTNLSQLTLGTPQTRLLYDGIVSTERYFFPIWEITPRASGDYLHFRGFTYKYTSPYDDKRY